MFCIPKQTVEAAHADICGGVFEKVISLYSFPSVLLKSLQNLDSLINYDIQQHFVALSNCSMRFYVANSWMSQFSTFFDGCMNITARQGGNCFWCRWI